MKNKRNIGLIIMVILSGPIVVNFLLSQSTPLTYGKDWHGFFGSYLGSIVGCIGAYLVAKMQIDQQFEYDRQKERELKRSYIVVEDFQGPVGLRNLESKNKYRIITTPEYEKIIRSNLGIAYYKITHFGYSPILLECRIEINYHDENGNDHHVDQVLGHLYNEIDVYLPMYREDIRELNINKIEVKYTTAAGEKMRYLQDIDKGREEYWLEGNKPEKIASYAISKVAWIEQKKSEH